MINGKQIKCAKTTRSQARRFYIRRFSGMPLELLGNEMQKERYLNTLTRKMLQVTGQKPYRR